ncbi:aminopeptidase Q-like [Coccinella septempunctata]|uniref:aminopeptidase Q-like n=1 Tax=Coccinella septempunctata TaxID=41139 RepID=UPI001D070EE8|nr:aminopeptidase Q-like [Coccinella septempunctata]
MHENQLLYEAFSMKRREVHSILQNVAKEITLQWMSELALEWWSDVWIRGSLAEYNAQNALSDMSESQSVENDSADSLLEFFHYTLALPFSKELNGDSAFVRATISLTDYKKFGLLLRMAQSLSNKNDLKDISMNFLKQNSFQKINQDDLWKIFEGYAPRGTFVKQVSFSEVMASCMYQGGFPEIEVIRDYKSGTATVNQKEYRSKINGSGSCWWIPIIYATKSDNQKFNNGLGEWLKCPHKAVILEYLSSSDWLLLNYNVNFLYRVNYDPLNWKHLHSTLENPMSYNDIPSLNRMQLIDDLFEFTARGNLTYDFLYEFLNYLRFDNSYAPWAAFAENVYILHWRIYPNREAIHLLNLYVQNVLRRHFNNRKLNSQGDSYSTFNLLITEIACFFELPDCLKEVEDAFYKYRKMKLPFHIESPFSIDLREIVFCYAIKHDNNENFKFLSDAFRNSTNIFEKQDMLSALFCTRKVSLLEGIPISGKKEKKRSVEHKEERNFQIRNIRGPLPRTAEKPIMLRSNTQGETSNIEVSTATEQNSTTFLSEESSTEPSESSITNTDMTPLDENTTMSIQEQSSIKTDTEVNNKSKIDSELPNLKHIIFRCDFRVVSDIFYRNIVLVDQQRALYYISLFTERINTKEDLDIFKRFLDENKEKLDNIRKNIEERIHNVEQNFVWQGQKTKSVIRALKKNLKVRNTRSNVPKNCLSHSVHLLSISGALIIFLGQ